MTITKTFNYITIRDNYDGTEIKKMKSIKKTLNKIDWYWTLIWIGGICSALGLSLSAVALIIYFI